MNSWSSTVKININTKPFCSYKHQTSFTGGSQHFVGFYSQSLFYFFTFYLKKVKIVFGT